jgi:hypothetical protein
MYHLAGNTSNAPAANWQFFSLVGQQMGGGSCQIASKISFPFPGLGTYVWAHPGPPLKYLASAGFFTGNRQAKRAKQTLGATGVLSHNHIKTGQHQQHVTWITWLAMTA